MIIDCDQIIFNIIGYIVDDYKWLILYRGEKIRPNLKKEDY